MSWPRLFAGCTRVGRLQNLGDGGAAAAKGARSASGAAVATSSGATLGGEENVSGRASALKQDDADVRTLQRRARNRDAARRTRMKKMMLLQARA